MGRYKAGKGSRRWPYPFMIVLTLTVLVNLLHFITLQNQPMSDHSASIFMRSANLYDSIAKRNPDISPLTEGAKEFYANRPYFPDLVRTAFYVVLGPSERCVLTVNLAFTLIMAWAVFGIGRQLYDDKAGLAAATILLSLQSIISYSVRMVYDEFIFASLMTLCLYFLIRSDGLRDGTYSLLFGMALGMAALSHMLFIAYLSPILLIILVQIVTRWSKDDSVASRDDGVAAKKHVSIALLVILLISAGIALLSTHAIRAALGSLGYTSDLLEFFTIEIILLFALSLASLIFTVYCGLKLLGQGSIAYNGIVSLTAFIGITVHWYSSSLFRSASFYLGLSHDPLQVAGNPAIINNMSYIVSLPSSLIYSSLTSLRFLLELLGPLYSGIVLLMLVILSLNILNQRIPKEIRSHLEKARATLGELALLSRQDWILLSWVILPFAITVLVQAVTMRYDISFFSPLLAPATLFIGSRIAMIRHDHLKNAAIGILIAALVIQQSLIYVTYDKAATFSPIHRLLNAQQSEFLKEIRLFDDFKVHDALVGTPSGYGPHGEYLYLYPGKSPIETAYEFIEGDYEGKVMPKVFVYTHRPDFSSSHFMMQNRLQGGRINFYDTQSGLDGPLPMPLESFDYVIFNTNQERSFRRYESKMSQFRSIIGGKEGMELKAQIPVSANEVIEIYGRRIA